MRLERWIAYAERHHSKVGLIALLATFGAVALVLDRPKGAVEMWFALPLFASGAALFAWVLWPSSHLAEAKEPTLATGLVRLLTLQGRLTKAFPVAGAAVIAGDLAYNLFVSATPAFLTEDVVVLLLGSVLIGYGFVPKAYAREREFVLVFLLALNAILVVPLLVARAYLHDFDTSVDLYSWSALAPETGALLSLLGVENVIHSVPAVTAPAITFTPQHMGVRVTVLITTACSGIYSFGIFAAGFFAFVLTETIRPSRGMWVFLAFGLGGAYLANILRMVVIVLVGYYTDTTQTDLQNMLVAHSYAGWVIFLCWVALFWGILFRFYPKRSEDKGNLAAPRTHGVLCGICGRALMPSLSGYRCACGRFYHTSCAVALEKCPMCHRPIRIAMAGSGSPVAH